MTNVAAINNIKIFKISNFKAKIIQHQSLQLRNGGMERQDLELMLLGWKAGHYSLCSQRFRGFQTTPMASMAGGGLTELTQVRNQMLWVSCLKQMHNRVVGQPRRHWILQNPPTTPPDTSLTQHHRGVTLGRERQVCQHH